MFFNLFPSTHVQAIARSFGESELSVRATVAISLLMALVAAAVAVGAAVDPTLLAGSDDRTAGSAQVLQAFVALGMVLGLSMTAGLGGLGHWLHSTARGAAAA